jgi:hypothetical protein
MNDDVDVMTEALRTRPFSPNEQVALARVQRFVARHDFASRRRAGFAVELLVAGVIAAITITFIVALTRQSQPAPHRTPVPITTSTPTPSTAPLPPSQLPPFKIEQTGRIDTAFEANAIFVSPGIVWVATHSQVYGATGKLFRVDASSTRQTGSWAIGGDPVAVSAAGGYVWVANGFGDGSRVLPYQNTVLQFNATTGALVHTYQITSPTAVVAKGSGAMVVSSRTANGPTDVHLLNNGRSTLIATVPGNLQGPSLSSESALAVCGDEVYLGVSELSNAGAQSINVYAVLFGGGSARELATIEGAWWPAITCDSTTLFVFPTLGSHDVRVNLTDGSVSTLPATSGITAVSFEAGLLFDVYNTDVPQGFEGYLGALSPATGDASAQPFPFSGPEAGGAFLLATDVPNASGKPGAWVVASVSSAAAAGDVLVLWHLGVA